MSVQIFAHDAALALALVVKTKCAWYNLTSRMFGCQNISVIFVIKQILINIVWFLESGWKVFISTENAVCGFKRLNIFVAWHWWWERNTYKQHQSCQQCVVEAASAMTSSCFVPLPIFLTAKHRPSSLAPASWGKATCLHGLAYCLGSLVMGNPNRSLSSSHISSETNPFPFARANIFS